MPLHYSPRPKFHSAGGDYHMNPNKERGGKSPQCRDEGHNQCPHLMGYEAGFNPRRLRSGFLAVLCGCECHSGCPLAGRDCVPGKAWPEECTCEASLRARSSEGQSSGGDDLQAEFMAELRLYRVAVGSVRPFSRGKSSAEVRELLIRELRSRGVPLPPDFVLDMDARALAGGWSSTNAFRAVVGTVRGLAGFLGELRDIFSNTRELPHPSERGVHFVPTAPPAEVILEIDAELLRALSFGPSDGQIARIPVYLERSGEQVAVYTDSGRVGTLRPNDVPAYLSILRQAEEEGNAPLVMATLTREAEGEAHLLLGVKPPPAGSK